MSGSSSSTNITFEDTSQYIFRNSSRNRGYFEGEAGYVSTSDDTDTTARQLTEAEVARLNSEIDALAAVSISELGADKTSLTAMADIMWDRAQDLYPTFKTLTDDKLADMKAEAIAQICLMESQWARTAGSSLNCLVGKMRTDAETEMARRMAAAVAADYSGMFQHETQALQIAFEAGMKARLSPVELGLNTLSSLTNILRGAYSTQDTNRDVHEVRVMGKFGHEAEDWSDNNGTYSGSVGSLASAAGSISSAASGGIA